MCLVVLACSKFKKSRLIISKIRSPLTLGLIMDGEFHNYIPLIHDGSRHEPPLRTFNIYPMFKEKPKNNLTQSEDIEKLKPQPINRQDFQFLRRNGGNLIEIFHTAGYPEFITRHPQCRSTVRQFAMIFNLVQRMEINSSNTNVMKTDMASVVFIIQNILDRFFHEGRGNSDLSTLVAGDILKLIKIIWSQPNLKLFWDKTCL